MMTLFLVREPFFSLASSQSAAVHTPPFEILVVHLLKDDYIWGWYGVMNSFSAGLAIRLS